MRRELGGGDFTLFIVRASLAVIRGSSVTPGGVCVVEDRIGVQHEVGESCSVGHCGVWCLVFGSGRVWWTRDGAWLGI